MVFKVLLDTIHFKMYFQSAGYVPIATTLTEKKVIASPVQAA